MSNMKNYGLEKVNVVLKFSVRTTIIELLNYLKVNYKYSRKGCKRLTRKGKIVYFYVIQ